MCGQWTWMCCLQNQMFRVCQHWYLALCWLSPQQIYNRSILGIDRLYNRIRKFFPSLALMRIWLMRTHCQNSIGEAARPGLTHFSDSHYLVYSSRDLPAIPYKYFAERAAALSDLEVLKNSSHLLDLHCDKGLAPARAPSPHLAV